jgi:hypothetical protein
MKYKENTKTMTTVNIQVPEDKAIIAIIANRLPSLVLSVGAIVVSVIFVIKF